MVLFVLCMILRLALLVQCWLVMDGRTDTMTAYNALAQRRAVKITFGNACNRWITLKVIWIAAIGQAIYHFLLVVCTNNDFILHFFQDTATFRAWVRVTLGNPSFLNRQLKLQATCAFQFVCKHHRFNVYYISGSMGVRNFSDSQNDQFITRTLAMVPFDMPHLISY